MLQYQALSALLRPGRKVDLPQKLENGLYLYTFSKADNIPNHRNDPANRMDPHYVFRSPHLLSQFRGWVRTLQETTGGRTAAIAEAMSEANMFGMEVNVAKSPPVQEHHRVFNGSGTGNYLLCFP